MRSRLVVPLATVLVAVVGLVAVAWGMGLIELPGEGNHDRAVVSLYGEDGDRLTTVDAAVADTRRERVRGLSEADSLENGSGMLFVHPVETTHTYVMRGMDLPLEIVFVETCDATCPDDADGQVTVVHDAPAPTDDADGAERYSGRAKWVLEVPRGFATDRDVEAGVYVEIRYVT